MVCPLEISARMRLRWAVIIVTRLIENIPMNRDRVMLIAILAFRPRALISV